MHKLPIQFYLPMPPSVSRMYINIKGIGRGGAGIYKKWLNEAERMVCAQDVLVSIREAL